MVFGALLIPAAFFFKARGWFGRDEFWGVLVFSAFLIRPDKLVDLARAWYASKQDTTSYESDYPKSPRVDSES